MIISKARVHSASNRPAQPRDGDKKLPDLEDLLEKRDFVGAITLLTSRRQSSKRDAQLLEWLAYAHFHFGEHDKALKAYRELLSWPDPDPQHHTYCAACLFYMGMYAEAEQAALQGPRCPLQSRILFHVAHKRGDEAALMQRHQDLSEGLEDEMSLASVHYQRGHYQEATDTYKRLLLSHREYTALNVYVALCYARLDYYDVSQVRGRRMVAHVGQRKEILADYLKAHATSPLAVNLKACNAFRVSDGKAAEAVLRSLSDAGTGKLLGEHVLLRHNVCVFRSGEGALQVLPPLAGVLPEARLNLVTFHLRRGNVGEAYALVRDMVPATPQEYILKATVHTLLGQREGSADHLKQAQHDFQVVGASPSECDTIPGRQAMASCFFLLRQFDDVLVFLESIRSYFSDDDDFNWNYGIALAATGKFQEAEAALAAVANEDYRHEDAYVAWMGKTLIMTGRGAAAWELYTAHEASGAAADCAGLLKLIGNDAYRMGQFFVAAQAFDALERLDPDPAYWEAKQGACIGVFQAVIAGKERVDSLAEAVAILSAGPGGGTVHQSAAAAHQLETMLRVIRAWADENGVDV